MSTILLHCNRDIFFNNKKNFNVNTANNNVYRNRLLIESMFLAAFLTFDMFVWYNNTVTRI